FLRDGDTDNFVGPLVSTDASAPTIQTLRLHHVDPAATQASLSIVLQGSSDIDSQADHRVTVSLNGHSIGEMTFAAFSRSSATFDVQPAWLTDGDNNISLAALNGDADVSAVVSVALTYAHTLDADDDQLVAVVDGGAQTSIAGFDSNDIQILDITDQRHPIRIAPLRVENGTATFTAPGSGPRTVIAIASSKLTHAASLVRNEPSSLFNSAGADMVIISHPSFVAALDPLVQLRQSQGLSVMVVKTDDIYDEFNYGAKDPQAIRSFLQNAMRWQKPPRYVLLVGDASYDERTYLGVGDFDFVPTKLVMSDLLLTSSDVWFTDFDDDGAPDVPIGRLSARTSDDVTFEVSKIVAYETSAMPVSQRLMFVSDADPSLDFHANSVALESNVPSGFDVVDVDASQSGGAAARQELLSGFDDALLVNYIGHGSVEIWSNYSFFASTDVTSLAKSNRAPIVLAMTCLNGFFQDVYTDSLAEALQRAPNGAVAVWASSALTSPEVQFPVNEILLKALLGPGDIRLGDAIMAAQKSSFTPDVRRTFILFGDPAMRVRTQ
ncbi:MAG: C25 family cysteine peptidase, partial [Thermoanaerobaculia bacterium]